MRPAMLWLAGTLALAGVLIGVLPRDPVAGACRSPADGSVTDLRSEPDYSDGNRLERWWTIDGCAVRRDVIMTRTGPEHCDFESVTDIVLTWPPGSLPVGTPTWDDVRIFLNDPTGAVPGNAKRVGLVPDPPDEARFSGFVQDGVSLWYVPGDDTSIYLVHHDRTERWPAGSYGCA